MRLTLVLMLCASTHALAITKGASLQKDPSSKARSVMFLQELNKVKAAAGAFELKNKELHR